MRFPVYFTKVIEAMVYVEADSMDEAEELVSGGAGYDDLPAGLCAGCSGWGQDWSVDDASDWDFVEVGES